MPKICRICKEEKTIELFQKTNNRCLQCHKLYLTEYRKNNYQILKDKNKIFREINKEKIKQDKKNFRNKNKEHIKNHKKEWYELNKPRILKRRKELYKIKRVILSDYDKYIKKQMNIVRKNISTSILKKLKNNNSSKGGKSSINYLGFTIEEFKIHIESLFSSPENLYNSQIWMTWENHGIYNLKSWNNEDPSTWKWQLDHIIPHSTFKYTDMECQEFKDCWSIDNLRPYSAKQNQHDGATRIRHKVTLNITEKENGN